MFLGFLLALLSVPAGDAALGTRSYDDYERPAACAACHVDIAMQWSQAMMSQAYTHAWDEIEYFQLAVPHTERDPAVAGIMAGCNGCHAPVAFLAGDVPPPPPAAGSRANESVSCDLCHTITGFQGDVPHNFNWVSEPGRLKLGNKPGLSSPHHDTAASDFIQSADFCGTCHNEMSPHGVWVKSTHLEWQEGPYGRDGVRCHVCHMPAAQGQSAKLVPASLVSQHLFHGAHDAGKLAGAVELRMHPETREVLYDDAAVIKVQLFNGKAGHKIPSGSAEDRLVWLEVTATDGEGRTWRLPVDPKGFDGEEWTIAADVLAYQDLGLARDDPDFPGLPRDGVPTGSRIFRLPYFDPQGRLTIQQWNTASLGVDYRLGPRETKIETYTWNLPEDVALGKVVVRAVLYYQLLVGPVAEHLRVPAEESEPVVVNQASTWIEVVD